MGAFEQLLSDHLPGLRRYARALLGDVNAADDLVQDTLERALKKRHLYREQASFKAWIYTLIRHQHIDNFRSRVVPMAEWVEGQHPAPDRADQGDVARDMTRALQNIDDQQRQVVLLVGLEGMSYRETAAILNIPVGTVMSKLSRGREALRQWMETREKNALRTVR